MKITAFIRKWVRKSYMYLCYMTRPRNEKTVYFASFRGQYSDNPRAISECLHRMAPEVKIVWLIKPQFKQYVPDYVTAIPPTPRLALKAQAQASVWVLNYIFRKQLGVYKGRDNYYIQTWHGDRGLKTIGYLTDYSKGKDYNGYDMSDCDLFVAASDYGVRKARQGFLYDGEVMVEGMPRNDKLVHIDKHREEAAEVKKRLGIDGSTKVLLYAPTFRDDKSSQQCAIDIAASVKSLESNGEKWLCLIRSHSLSKGISVDSNSSPYLDVTSYPDMADLLLITDLLITDYSSCAGDFLLTGKPVVLAHFDRSDYEAQGRPLWVNPKEAGYLVAKNQDELNDILTNFYTYDHQAIANKVNRFYGTKETGQSSEAIVSRIIQKLNKH
ncbi:MAG: CDP-glycerol glycerophosphotransferase family protein [Prevotella sp.]|nr:CDP-glycerol glycerophosphotransferase family protein [Prevotella sp.]